MKLPVQRVLHKHSRRQRGVLRCEAKPVWATAQAQTNPDFFSETHRTHTGSRSLTLALSVAHALLTHVLLPVRFSGNAVPVILLDVVQQLHLVRLIPFACQILNVVHELVLRVRLVVDRECITPLLEA